MSDLEQNPLAGAVVEHEHVTIDEDVFYGFQNVEQAADDIKREGATPERVAALIYWYDDLQERLSLARLRNSMDPHHHRT